MAEAHHVAALGKIGRFGGFLGALQGCVGALMRIDLLDQQIRLAARFGFGCSPALFRQHEQPGELDI